MMMPFEILLSPILGLIKLAVVTVLPLHPLDKPESSYLKQ